MPRVLDLGSLLTSDHKSGRFVLSFREPVKLVFYCVSCPSSFVCQPPNPSTKELRAQEKDFALYSMELVFHFIHLPCNNLRGLPVVHAIANDFLSQLCYHPIYLINVTIQDVLSFSSVGYKLLHFLAREREQ